MYKIFIVEDDGGIAGAIKKEAISWGFDARTAKNFSDIIAEFSEYSPQLVLLDISLPFYNGYYWCERYVLYQACLLSSYPPRRTT